MFNERTAAECTEEKDYYIPDENLVAAAEVALELGQPLLLTGEPGTGKTTFARHMAWTLAPAYFARVGQEAGERLPLHAFHTKSISVATDLFYRFDSLRRFHAGNDQTMSRDNVDYIDYEALGKAILETWPRESVGALMRQDEFHVGPRRSVVLIDEIDKAPRDFPNDLLNEIDQMAFSVPELRHKLGTAASRVTANQALRPIVILTSNSEKNLPAPFLRRCVFHHIQLPDENRIERMTAIVDANLPRQLGQLTKSAIEFFYAVRKLQLDKSPTTYELVQWIRALDGRKHLAGGFDSSRTALADLPGPYLASTLGVLVKSLGDIEKVSQLAGRSLTAARQG